MKRRKKKVSIVVLRLRARWQRIKRHSFTAVGIIAFIALIFLVYWFHWTWTGFNKTLWDWMQLLIIPLCLHFLIGPSQAERSSYKVSGSTPDWNCP